MRPPEQDRAVASKPDGPPALRPPSGAAQIFAGFARIGLLGFGGVAAWARHVIVEERRWLSERDYAETAGLAQVLPGPNVGTAAIFIGRRFAGWRGAVAATAGLYAGPLVILLLLAGMQDVLAAWERLPALMKGLALAASGLLVGAGLRMGQNLRLAPPFLALAAIACGGAILRLPLWQILLVLAPLALWLAWRRR
jgi:chromate transporter